MRCIKSWKNYAKKRSSTIYHYQMMIYCIQQFINLLELQFKRIKTIKFNWKVKKGIGRQKSNTYIKARRRQEKSIRKKLMLLMFGWIIIKFLRNMWPKMTLKNIYLKKLLIKDSASQSFKFLWLLWTFVLTKSRKNSNWRPQNTKGERINDLTLRIQKNNLSKYLKNFHQISQLQLVYNTK